MVTVSALMVLGSFLFFYGFHLRHYLLLLGGRMIFGFGGESLRVSNSAIETAWFSGRELPFAMSVEYAVAGLGTFAVDSAEPAIYGQTGSVTTIFLGCCLMTLVAFIGSLLVHRLDSRKEHDAGENVGVQEEDGRLRFSVIKTFSADYWTILFATTLGIASIGSFNNISSEFFQTRLHFSIQTAGVLMGTESLSCALLAPWVGRFFGYTPHKVKFGKSCARFILAIALAAGVCMCVSVLWLFYRAEGMAEALTVLVLLGLCDSVYNAALKPLVPSIAPANALGLAYSLFVCVDNLFGTIGPLTIGAIIDNSSSHHAGYYYVFRYRSKLEIERDDDSGRDWSLRGATRVHGALGERHVLRRRGDRVEILSGNAHDLAGHRRLPAGDRDGRHVEDGGGCDFAGNRRQKQRG